jgi:hypothetical protein
LVSSETGSLRLSKALDVKTTETDTQYRTGISCCSYSLGPHSTMAVAKKFQKISRWITFLSPICRKVNVCSGNFQKFAHMKEIDLPQDILGESKFYVLSFLLKT